MRRTGWIFIFACVLMLSAGFVLGCLWAQRLRPEPVRPPWMAQLNLSAAQRQQFDAIWMPLHKKTDEVWEHRHQLSQERDQALRNLLSDAQKSGFDKIEQDYRAHLAASDQERKQAKRNLLSDAQKADFDKIEQDYSARTAALDQEHEKIVQDANQRSRELLTEEQKAKWDVLSKQMHEHRWHAGSTQRSTTRPSSRPADGNS